MAQNDTPVKALVLAGGGARGSYQCCKFTEYFFAFRLCFL